MVVGVLALVWVILWDAARGWGRDVGCGLVLGMGRRGG